MAIILSVLTTRDRIFTISWKGLKSSDIGEVFEMSGATERSIQFDGVFGVGGVVRLEGSNDGENWHVLTDPQANVISKSGSSIEAITELTKFVRPNVISGDESTNITATLLVKMVR
jgi:hypothetical protein